MLRRALDETPGDNSYIVILPGRGCQFVVPVQVLVPENVAVVPDAATSVSHGPSEVIFQQQTIRTSVITEEEQQLSLPSSRRPGAMRLVAALAMAVTAAAGIYGGSSFTRPRG